MPNSLGERDKLPLWFWDSRQPQLHHQGKCSQHFLAPTMYLADAEPFTAFKPQVLTSALRPPSPHCAEEETE